jgi:hypothetical protein
LRQFRQGAPRQHFIHRLLDALPEGADGAAVVARADFLVARVAGTEIGRDQPPAQLRQHFTNADPARRTRQHVSARLASDALHETALAQPAHQLGNVGNREPLAETDLVDGQVESPASLRELQQAPQSVFFLGADLHEFSSVAHASASDGPCGAVTGTTTPAGSFC